MSDKIVFVHTDDCDSMIGIINHYNQLIDAIFSRGTKIIHTTNMGVLLIDKAVFECGYDICILNAEHDCYNYDKEEYNDFNKSVFKDYVMGKSSDY